MIAVEGTKQPALQDDLFHTLKTAVRSFFVNEEETVVLVGGIIHGVDQVPLLAGNPFMGAAVLMDQHSRHRRTFTTLTMSSALGRFIVAALFLKLILDPGVAAGSSLAAVARVKVFGRPAVVAVFEAINQSHDFIDRCLTGRSLSKTLIE